MSRIPYPTRALILLIGGMTALTAACTSPADDDRVGASASPALTGPAPAGESRHTAAPAPSGTSAAPSSTSAGPASTPPDEVAVTSAAPCTDRGPLIEDAVWIEVDGGASLEVTPAASLRGCALAAADDSAWTELVALVPDADTPGMAAQMSCHIVFAPAKEVWHLEPWRPVVDNAELLRTRCNPGGPDPDLP